MPAKRKSQEQAALDAQKQNLQLISIYKNRRIKCEYQCLKCYRKFFAWPGSIQQGCGCFTCARRKTQEQAEFEASEHGFKLCEKYIGDNIKVLYRCLKCLYERPAVPSNIKQGAGCPNCYGNVKLTIENLNDIAIKRAAVLVSDFDDYQNNKTKLWWKCNRRNHVFEARVNDLDQGHGCYYCFLGRSSWEDDFYTFLLNYIPDLKAKTKGLLKNKRFHTDVWDPVNRLALELDGDYWHDRPEAIERDARKNKEYIEAGIKFLRIRLSEFKKDPEVTYSKALAFFGYGPVT